MPPLSALVLQASGLHRSTAVTALHHLGYSFLSEVSSNAFALDRLRSLGGVHLLICDVRSEPVARLEFLQTVAREGLAQGVVVSGELAPGTWTALAHLLQVQGLKVYWLGNEAATLERLRALLADFQPQEARSALSQQGEQSKEGTPAEVLGSGALRAFLQPKVTVATAQIYGFEVLARWQREDGQLLAPGEFLPVLRRNGQLDKGLFELMRQAIEALRAHNRADLELSFNLESEQLAQTDFASAVERVFRRLEMDPKNVTFELTETSPLHAPPLSLENVLRLRLLGCGLAIDDFGSGHSTLQRLVELPFTELKLDRTFLADLNNGDPRRHIVLRNALALGRELGLMVVAEGVENASQHRQLQSLECESAQGHLFGKPVSTSELGPVLRGVPTRLQKPEVLSAKADSVIRLAEQ
ncbi:EAL domain-containing protein [Pseudomonas sp. BGr12]|uniref:EAL domain-containing protein n=1 Tax=Pseudomonas denitrificans TaxID=43306 RepID=A0A9X7R3M0_PSEDE|nr:MULTISPECIES: EAL domain-containing protein [Pseudomonadaceae]OQR27427.1 two-component response regulator [Pseudomonas sp. T]MBD9578874.1 EAL domain-containing protein [Pseudomonas sp. PDM23]MBD9674606.1 EAL domain-containing protein [Pseudomonas sp. PDM21]MBD9684433.1 EAL domain-containing protein [Pseudomonas sp. PDM20]MDL2430353.1 EAL domain-containing protein [Pseudomonas sp. BJa5]